MNIKIKRILALILMACLLLSVSAYAFADGTADAAQCYNIMLVIDGSRSLSSGIDGKATDPDGLRYEAIDSFIDTLQDKGQYVGAIVFMANPGTGTSEEDMYKGIRLDTWKDGPVSIENNKSNLKKQIKNADLSSTVSGAVGETDIGTALYWAQKRLEQAHDENGLPGALFLFTDGLNALTYPGPKAQSEQNMADATAALKDNGVAVCGVLLNAGKKQVDSTQLRDIVCAANGISAGDLDLGNYFIEITNAADCANSTDNFTEMIGFSFGKGEGETITSSCEKSFRIPGTGVEEVNIRLRTLSGESLPKGMKVSITQPDGTEISGALAAAICSSGRTYQLYKIKQPDAGTWTIHIDLPKNNEIVINYNPIFSIYVESEMASTPAASDLHANMDAEVDCYLTRNGQRVTDESDYREYSCTLEITDTATGEVNAIDISKNGNGEFKATVPLTYGTYDVRTVFSCDQLSTSSPKTTWCLENNAPTATGMNAPVSFSIFNLANNSKDMSDYYTDIEDGKNLMLSIVGDGIEGIGVDGTKLTIDVLHAKSGECILRATDSQGAYVDIPIQLKNVTLRNILLLLAALLLIAIVVILIIRYYNSFIPKGVCTVEFEVDAEDSQGREKEYEIRAELTPPGLGTKRSTTLYDMIQADLSREMGSIRSYCDDERIPAEAVERLVEQIQPELDKVKVKCSVESRKNKKGKTAMIRVQFKRVNTPLYGDSVTITPCGKSITLGYYEPEDDGQAYYSGPNDDAYNGNYSKGDSLSDDSYSSTSYDADDIYSKNSSSDDF